MLPGLVLSPKAKTVKTNSGQTLQDAPFVSCYPEEKDKMGWFRVTLHFSFTQSHVFSDERVA